MLLQVALYAHEIVLYGCSGELDSVTTTHHSAWLALLLLAQATRPIAQALQVADINLTALPLFFAIVGNLDWICDAPGRGLRFFRHRGPSFLRAWRLALT